MRKRLVLLLLFFTLLPLYGQSNLKLEAVGARLGWGKSADLQLNNIIIPGLCINWGELQPHLSLFGYMDYWNKSKKAVNNKSISWRLVGISAITKYTFPNRTNFAPYIGGGIGFNFGKGDASSTFDLALHVIGGVSAPFSSKLTGLLELKYSMDGADYLAIFTGMRYRIK